MTMERHRCIPSPAGPLTISATAEGITAIRFNGTPDNTPGGADAGAADSAGTAGGAKTPVPGARGLAGTASDSVKHVPGTAGTASGSGNCGDAGGGDTCCTPDALLRQAVRELEEYFAGTRRSFTLPLAPAGTPFQQAVWNALRTIPYGETRSYGQIAAQIGRPKACRAVGMANNRNPIAIVVPCHRVVGSTGALVGYAGGLSVKERLLTLEAADQA